MNIKYKSKGKILPRKTYFQTLSDQIFHPGCTMFFDLFDYCAKGFLYRKVTKSNLYLRFLIWKTFPPFFKLLNLFFYFQFIILPLKFSMGHKKNLSKPNLHLFCLFHFFETYKPMNPNLSIFCFLFSLIF